MMSLTRPLCILIKGTHFLPGNPKGTHMELKGNPATKLIFADLLLLHSPPLIFILVRFFLGDAPLYLEKATCLPREFLPSHGSTLCLSNSMCRFIRSLVVLAPVDSNVAVYAKCC